MTLNRLHRYAFLCGLIFVTQCGSPESTAELADDQAPASTGVMFDPQAPLPMASMQASTRAEEARFFWDKFTTNRIRIAGADGNELAAIVFEPKDRYFPGLRPAVIFVNSWSLTEDEYHLQARNLADRGYVVVSYATRGFSSSEGTVTVGGPKDIRDVSAVIDWMEAHTRVDVKNIGMAGVSYGAGISLLALAHEPRVKTAIAMSGWANLEQALYGRETIREVWLDLLLVSGKLLGRLDPEISQQAQRLRENRDVEAVRAWASERSVLSVVDKINARKAPVLMANSYQDALFPPLQMVDFYQKLEGPKAFYLDRGIHASSAFSGLLGMPSEIWDQADRWFDFYLKGLDNGIDKQSPLSFLNGKNREYYETFPELEGKTKWMKLTPANELADLGPDEDAVDEQGNTLGKLLRGLSFIGNTDSGATTGLPLISDTVDATLGIPVTKVLKQIDAKYAAVYSTDTVDATTRVRGSPQIRFWAAPHKDPQQLVAYLYDADRWGRGTLITHGVVSERTINRKMNELSLDLNVAAYDVPKGHKLVLVLDTRDPLYTNFAKAAYNVGMLAEDIRLTAISLPVIR